MVKIFVAEIVIPATTDSNKNEDVTGNLFKLLTGQEKGKFLQQYHNLGIESIKRGCWIEYSAYITLINHRSKHFVSSSKKYDLNPKSYGGQV